MTRRVRGTVADFAHRTRAADQADGIIPHGRVEESSDVRGCPCVRALVRLRRPEGNLVDTTSKGATATIVGQHRQLRARSPFGDPVVLEAVCRSLPGAIEPAVVVNAEGQVALDNGSNELLRGGKQIPPPSPWPRCGFRKRTSPAKRWPGRAGMRSRSVIRGVDPLGPGRSSDVRH